MLVIEPRNESDIFEPLERVTVLGARAGTLVARDGLSREYARKPARSKVSFTIAGALGRHQICLEDDNGCVTETVTFPVNCQTAIEDQGGRFKRLFHMLHYTMVGFSEAGSARMKGRIYHFFVSWLRDHVHTLKGMKYFYGDVKSAIDLYHNSQRADGMIFDLIRKRTPELTHREAIFRYDGFIKPIDGKSYEFQRIPAENDVEYLYIEGIYYTWKATGDNAWMASRLDSAIKAFGYSTSDPYRWSRKYKLLKRAFTIDTWDYQPTEDEAISGHCMVVDKKKTRFGVMHGDNTGFAVGCGYLAEMLVVAGREKEAKKFSQLGKDIKKRLDRLSWNGKFYTHHVPEDPKVKRDLGVDQSKQVSQSNSYALNRGLTHAQCVAIIKTYQRIRRQMPKTSPGEWYAMYPPFDKGFDRHHAKWDYMNGGVTTITAGELSHGAFEHGFEEYGADILSRLVKIADDHDGHFHCTMKGKLSDPPRRTFKPLDLRAAANVDFTGNGAPGVPMHKWNLDYTCKVAVDLRGVPTGRQTLGDVPFTILDPQKNGRGAMLGLSDHKSCVSRAEISVNAKAHSIYFLHAVSGLPRGKLAGDITIEYADGSTHQRHIYQGSEVDFWWFPGGVNSGFRSTQANARIVWRGKNKVSPHFGLTSFGLTNPYPNKKINRIVLESARNGSYWYVLGATTCDKDVYFPSADTSFGIPDNWGAAAVVYAMVEGLAGVKDTGVAFNRALIAPRWAAAGVDRAGVTIKYEASGGYVRYQYAYDRKKRKITLTFTGTPDETELSILMPKGKKPAAASVNGTDVTVREKKVDKSVYAVLRVKGSGVSKLVLSVK